MPDEGLRIPKELVPATLWVHPQGRIDGSVFVRTRGGGHARREDPLDVLNDAEPFVAVKLDDPNEVKFFAKRAIIRLEHAVDPEPTLPGDPPPACALSLSDGTELVGELRRPMPPDRARLYDHLNRTDERFLRLHHGGDRASVINKAHVVCATAVRHSALTLDAETADE